MLSQGRSLPSVCAGYEATGQLQTGAPWAARPGPAPSLGAGLGRRLVAPWGRLGQAPAGTEHGDRAGWRGCDGAARGRLR